MTFSKVFSWLTKITVKFEKRNDRTLELLVSSSVSSGKVQVTEWLRAIVQMWKFRESKNSERFWERTIYSIGRQMLFGVPKARGGRYSMTTSPGELCHF